MKTLVPVFSILLVTLIVCIAAEPVVQPLWPDGVPLGEKATADDPDLTIYLPAVEKANGAAVVICPGGGYWALAMDHEGHQVAQWLNSMGVAGIIVSYRRGPGAAHPVPLMDAQHAIRTTRANAAKWNIDPNRIGVIGFSAGGHLASSTGVHFDYGKNNAENIIEQQSCRPDFMILVYPVITMVEKYGHQGSKDNLLGKNASQEMAEKMSSDLQVTQDTPPTFLLLTSEDTVVPAENGISFYLACHKNNVPCEMHVFEKGPHGFGLAPFDPVLSDWAELCEQWLRVRGVF